MGVYAKRDIAATTGVEIELKFFDAEKNVWIEKVRGRVARCEKSGLGLFRGDPVFRGRGFVEEFPSQRGDRRSRGKVTRRVGTSRPALGGCGNDK